MADTATRIAQQDETCKEIADLIEAFRNDIAGTVRGFALSMSDIGVNGCSAFQGNWQNIGPLDDKAADIALALIIQDARFSIPRLMENYVDAWPTASMLLVADQVRVTV